MNICLVSREYPPETGFGGIGTYTYNLAKALSEKGHEVTVITQALKTEKIYIDKKVKVYRIKDIKIPIKGITGVANFLTFSGFGHILHSYSVFKKIDEIIRERGKFDVIECPLWSGEGFLYSQKIGIPLVVRLQTPIFKLREILGQKKNFLQEYYEKKALEKAVIVAAISKNIGSMISSYYKIPKSKIKISFLGTEFPDIKKPLYKKNSFKLLYVGRLEKRKGAIEFIEAIPQILNSNPKIRIDIVGKDINQAPGQISFREYFNKVVPENLRNRVRFHGLIDLDKLKKFYAGCDVFIAPSRYESFGLIYLEAMAFGKPVIGTRIGAIPEIVRHDEVGLLIDVNNSSQIADAVLKLFSREKLRERLGKKAFNYVRQNFSNERFAQNTLEIYELAREKFYGRS